MVNPSRMHIIALAIMSLGSNSAVLAQNQNVETQTINDVPVFASQIKKIGEDKVSRDELDNEMVEDANDLVRYQTGVGVSAARRSGSQGFAIRGQDGNRVAITVDGVAQPNYEANAVNNTYGYYPSARPSTEFDFIQDVNIQKGADSWQVGNGALGGAVNFKTREARDLIAAGNTVGLYAKSGYASKNQEWANTLGMAYSDHGLDALIMYAAKRGHELKNSGEGADIWGSGRGIPDAAKHKQDSWMGKLSYQINDNHKIGANFLTQDYKNDVNNQSFDQMFYPGAKFAPRDTTDYAKRENFGLSYLYTPDLKYLDFVDVNVAKQRSTSRALTNSNGRISDRRLDNSLKLATVHVATQALGATDTFGGHRLSARLGYGDNQFTNTEFAMDGIKKTGSFTPVDAKNWFISLDDKIQFNDIFSGVVGVRYDQYRFKPDLEVPVSEGSYSSDFIEKRNRNISNATWLLGLDAKLNNAWVLNTKISTGFRAPTATELYSRYNSNQSSRDDGVLIQPNPNLKPEKSINYEIGLSGKGTYGVLNTSLYHTRYQDMIPDVGELIGYEDKKLIAQLQNVEKTSVTGLEVSGSVYLDRLGFAQEGWLLTGAASYAKGSSSTGKGLMSLQPFKAVIGFGYDQPDHQWGAMSYMTYYGKKSSHNTTVQTLETTAADGKIKEYDFPYLSQSALVFDVVGFYNIKKDVVVRAGLFNLFDKKYATWDDRRSIAMYGHDNRVSADGSGLDRFTAPRRHFSVSLEAKF